MQSARNEGDSIRGQFESIPLVDVSDLGRAAGALDHAARHVGFLYVTGHGVEPALVAALHEQAALFFALPEQVKRAYYIGLSPNHRGYVPPGEEVFYEQSKDSKEAFDLSRDLPDDPDFLAGNRLLGPNVWPRELPHFRDVVSRYYDAVFTFGTRLIAGFALALGLPADHFAPMLQKPPSQLRLLHYPPGEDAPGIGSHTDYECFTILHTTAPGLEVMNAEGRWVDAPPMPDAFVVNLGDMMEILTAGRWVSTAHRVRNVREERYSFPLFFSLDYATVVEPLPGFEDRAYPRVIAGEHLLAQTAQTFRYFEPLIASGRFTMPLAAKGLSSFGRDRA
ncbi:MAG TPA: 2-oxoglutarate and iron-dependent oxygenase domain-containing protein [Polyangiales bacterium]|nr:2-oxoglutarate and iron-dependent oxygenase domain-containing protein [Polyangiales bacterium]